MPRPILRASLLRSLLLASGFLQAVALAQVTVTITPAAHEMRVRQTKTFYVSVANTTNKTVTWSVNGVPGGNATVGTISVTGLYSAPATTPVPNQVRIRVASAVAPNPFAEATVSVLNPIPSISAITPTAVNVGAFNLTITGTNFIAGSKVVIFDMPVTTTLVSDKELKATATISTAQEGYLKVVNPDPGTSTSGSKYFRVMPPATLSLTPETTTVRLGVTKQFYASVSNALDRTSTWYVNDIKGGNATFGTISETGLYTPPSVLPPVSSTALTGTSVPAPAVTIKAMSNANNAITDTSVVTLWNPIPALKTALPVSLKIGINATITLDGEGFVPGARVFLGGKELAVSSLTTTKLTVAAQPTAVPGGKAAVFVANPTPGGGTSNGVAVSIAPQVELVSAAAAAKFLNRTSFGPSPDAIAKVQTMGAQAWLDEQFTLPPSPLPDPIPDTTSLTPATRAFYVNAMTSPDQLRQRVAFALGQILVTSAVKTGGSNQMVPYQRLLSRHAFGNFFILLKEVTLNPTMGRFLDMVNNVKADPRRGIEPNENYARELLQLFTLGLTELNMDGSNRLDGLGRPIPTYTEEQIRHFARALTGWTYPTRPGEVPRAINPSYYEGRMIATETYHDTTTKNLLLGEISPAGRTAMEDVDAVIGNISRHPNVPPFISLRLIQRLVMGNPSPAYVGRVAQVFRNTNGDLAATVRAIVTDVEADFPAANQGKLKEPILFVLSFLRSIGATVGIEHGLNSYANNMGQGVWNAPSVFNFFSPFFRVNGIVAPEFQVTTPSVSMNRVNFIYRAVNNSIGQSTIDITAFERLASDPAALLDALNAALMQGSMSQQMRDSIMTAITAATDLRTRARNAIYLVGSASQFQVEP